jgi:hypothetical protein
MAFIDDTGLFAYHMKAIRSIWAQRKQLRSAFPWISIAVPTYGLGLGLGLSGLRLFAIYGSFIVFPSGLRLKFRYRSFGDTVYVQVVPIMIVLSAMALLGVSRPHAMLAQLKLAIRWRDGDHCTSGHRLRR